MSSLKVFLCLSFSGAEASVGTPMMSLVPRAEHAILCQHHVITTTREGEQCWQCCQLLPRCCGGAETPSSLCLECLELFRLLVKL